MDQAVGGIERETPYSLCLEGDHSREMCPGTTKLPSKGMVRGGEATLAEVWGGIQGGLLEEGH